MLLKTDKKLFGINHCGFVVGGVEEMSQAFLTGQKSIKEVTGGSIAVLRGSCGKAGAIASCLLCASLLYP
jgi:hypothetical protein